MKGYLISLVLVLTIAATKGGLLSCPNPDVHRNFTVSEFLGKWYVIQETKGVLSRVCPSLVVKEGTEGDYSVLIKETNLIWKKAAYTKVTVKLDKDAPANFTVWYYGPANLLKIKQRYSILDTDYKNYAVVWGCNKVFGIPNERVFILGREQTLSDDIIHHAFDLLDSNRLKRQGLDTTFQDDCFDM